MKNSGSDTISWVGSRKPSISQWGRSGSDRWYTSGQAANGAKAYQKACASCHGAKLLGGMAPALVGKQFWLTYGGKKVSTLWAEVHTQLPMSDPGSVSAKTSIDIMAFLLEKNGVRAGSTPLTTPLISPRHFRRKSSRKPLARRFKTFEPGRKVRPSIVRCCELLGGSDVHR
jgi:cytochrome c